MIEDREQLTSRKFHKHRLIFRLAAMRHYARELRHNDFNLLYFQFNETKGYSLEKVLQKVLTEGKFAKIITFEIEDKNLEKRVQEFCRKTNCPLEIKKSPQFLISRDSFKTYLERFDHPSLKSFYEYHRQKLNILMDSDGQPLGGSFSFAEEERLKWNPKNAAPKFPISVRPEHELDVIHLVDKEFTDHPGDAHTFWYPTTRSALQEALLDFCKYRLAEYGPYEDCICPQEDFLFHSVLSPALTVGLLTPQEVIDIAVQHSKEQPVSLNSLESFIRKILGHREYARGIYQNFSEVLEMKNFWNHQRLLNDNWYLGKTRVPPLDDALKKALRLSYNHYTERLKIICNMMNLSELNPHEAYRWFNEMQMDATPWALVPNVYGLGLYADGGLVSHNLHICGSNYWLKISTYKKEDWSLEVDGLYWRFIDRNQDFFAKNPRLTVMTKNLEKLPADRRELLWTAADGFLARNTVYP